MDQGILRAPEPPLTTSWTLSEQAGQPVPDPMQRLLSTTDWDPDLVRDDLRSYVVSYLGDREGVLIVDETGFLKKGDRSAGVARQYTGTVRESLPSAGLPRSRSWRWGCWPARKGDRRYAWARARINGERDPDAEYWLLARRSLTDPDVLAYYLCRAPERISLAELVRVAGARWAIEETFQTAKGQTGLDHYQVRQYTGWYRHITLSMLAHAFLTVTRSKRGLDAETTAISSR